MFTLPKILIDLGLLLVMAGVLTWLLEEAGIPLGRLPVSIIIERENMSFYFPWVTSLVASVFFSLIARFIKF